MVLGITPNTKFVYSLNNAGLNKTCIILCAFHTYFPFILSALSSQNPVQIFQNYINIDWFCNMSIPSCLDCFFTILLM